MIRSSLNLRTLSGQYCRFVNLNHRISKCLAERDSNSIQDGSGIPIIKRSDKPLEQYLKSADNAKTSVEDEKGQRFPVKMEPKEKVSENE